MIETSQGTRSQIKEPSAHGKQKSQGAWINSATGEHRPAGSYRTGNLGGQPSPDGQAQFFTTPPRWQDAGLAPESE